MGIGVASEKSPKTGRRLKTPPRQVHFEEDDNRIQVTTAAAYAARANANANANGNSNSTNTNKATGNAAGGTQGHSPVPNFTQPTSFPAVGIPPETYNQQGVNFGTGPWFKSSNPGLSVNFSTGAVQVPSGQAPSSHLAAPYAPGLGLLNTPAPHHQFHQPQLQQLQQPPPNFVTMAADYQNTAPLPHGVNFQPPVPDTTYGPMSHVYIPRFDGGLAAQQVYAQPGFQQPTVPGFQPQQPGYFVQQPQPVMMGAQPTMVNPMPQFQAIPAAGGGGNFMGGGGPPIISGSTGPLPEVAGFGRTLGEEQLRQVQFAHANKVFEPQEFKPADDDPSRFYYVRELDNNWTQRTRFSIDHMGDSRWYVTDEGWFYAVRLPN